jgi:hypothetical protein
MEYFSEESINKFEEISKIIVPSNQVLPDIIKNMFKLFYKNYIIKKNIEIQDATNEEIKNYKENMNYIFKETKKRYDEFKESYYNNKLKVLVSVDYPFIKMVYLENNSRVFELFNLFVTYYLTKLDLNKNINESKKDLLAYIYNSPFKREIRVKDLPKKNKMPDLFEYYHYNSIGLFVSGVTNSTGFTASTDEELHKLFWHELLHYSKADTYNNGRKVDIKYSNQNITFEGFTEFMCVIYHILEIVSKLKYINKYTNEKCYKLINEFINIETYWSLFTVAKLLKLMGYKEDFFNHNIIKFNKITILSYYIGKSILLFNFYSIMNENYFNDDLTAKKKYYAVENNIFNDISEEYIIKLKKCFDNLKYASNSIGYICIELKDFDNIMVFVKKMSLNGGYIPVNFDIDYKY